eukprot:354857-Chlamydomonas_euryale.AAC.52
MPGLGPMPRAVSFTMHHTCESSSHCAKRCASPAPAAAVSRTTASSKPAAATQWSAVRPPSSVSRALAPASTSSFRICTAASFLSGSRPTQAARHSTGWPSHRVEAFAPAARSNWVHPGDAERTARCNGVQPRKSFIASICGITCCRSAADMPCARLGLPAGSGNQPAAAMQWPHTW